MDLLLGTTSPSLSDDCPLFLQPLIDFVPVGVHRGAPGVPMPKHRESFRAFPSLHSATCAQQVGSNLFPAIQFFASACVVSVTLLQHVARDLHCCRRSNHA